jgi:hypothetical protein
MIGPTALEPGTTRAIGPAAYCSNGFQSVACFRFADKEGNFLRIFALNFTGRPFYAKKSFGNKARHGSDHR